MNIDIKNKMIDLLIYLFTSILFITIAVAVNIFVCIGFKTQWLFSPHILVQHGESHDTLQ